MNANREAVTKLSHASPAFLEHTFPRFVGVTCVQSEIHNSGPTRANIPLVLRTGLLLFFYGLVFPFEMMKHIRTILSYILSRYARDVDKRGSEIREFIEKLKARYWQQSKDRSACYCDFCTCSLRLHFFLMTVLKSIYR